MNNAYAMAITELEKKQKTEAGIITAGFAVFIILLMFLLKWSMPVIEPIVEDVGVEVEITLPPDPPEPPQTTEEDGGGGGGNVATAAGPSGVAPETAPTTSKDFDDDTDEDAPVISKPKAVAEKSPRINEQSVAKSEPKPIVVPPAPKAKATMGKGVLGNNKGATGVDDYGISGGRTGNGTGVGNGNGTGGGNGNGSGGGNGNGVGTGNGPKITRGDRKIVRHYSFDGDLEKAVVYANISVSPEGVGKFVSIAKGSSNSNSAYKTAIVQYLQNIKFDKADHESMVTVQFNFRVN